MTGRWAATAGTQLRRTATLPFVPSEVESGAAGVGKSPIEPAIAASLGKDDRGRFNWFCCGTLSQPDRCFQSAVSRRLGMHAEILCVPIGQDKARSRTGSRSNLCGFMQEQRQVPSVDFSVKVTQPMKRLTGGAEFGCLDSRQKFGFQAHPGAP